MKELCLLVLAFLVIAQNKVLGSVDGRDISDCIRCNGGFDGFGKTPKKCGCCPWPCHCNCKRPGCPTIAPAKCGCLDLSFIVDASGSIGSLAWGITQISMVDYVTVLNECQEDCDNVVKVAPITFAVNATLHWGFNDPENLDMDTINSNLSLIPQLFHQTNIVEAIEVAVNAYSTDREECVDAVILMTDGKVTFRRGEIPAAGAALQAITDNLYCVIQTSKHDIVVMETICGNLTRIYDTLQFPVIVNAICEKMIESVTMTTLPPCDLPEVCYCCCTPEQFWGARDQGFYV